LRASQYTHFATVDAAVQDFFGRSAPNHTNFKGLCAFFELHVYKITVLVCFRLKIHLFIYYLFIYFNILLSLLLFIVLSIKIASVACLNPKRLTLRSREIAGDIYDQQIKAFFAASQKGFLAAKASDD
jgi:hypothetical protein